MKKIILLVLITSITIGMISCTSNTNSTTTTNKETESEDTTTDKEENEDTNEKKEEMKEISLSETISNDSFDLTLNNVELTYDVLPEDVSGFYTHYQADQGKVYINIDVDIKNNQKQNLDCDRIMDVGADYNNGYTYRASPVVEDSSTGFTYANITSIAPLETKGMRYLIDCPQEVEETDNPLVVNFDLNGETYSYTIR